MPKKPECYPVDADSLSGFGVAFQTLTVSEIYAVIGCGFARLVELTAKPEPAPDVDLTRQEAAKLVGEPTADTFYRHGLWERARVRTFQKQPLYSRSKLLTIKTEQDRKAAIANSGLRAV